MLAETTLATTRSCLLTILHTLKKKHVLQQTFSRNEFEEFLEMFRAVFLLKFLWKTESE